MKRGCDESNLSFWVWRTYANMLFKYHAIKVGGEGVSQKLTFAHRGEGGVWRGAKSAHAILEQPLTCLYKFYICCFLSSWRSIRQIPNGIRRHIILSLEFWHKSTFHRCWLVNIYFCNLFFNYTFVQIKFKCNKCIFASQAQGAIMSLICLSDFFSLSW